jgi:hypothetical protein
MLAASLPTGDWQFWVVTVISALAVLILLRNVLPIPALRRARKRRQGEKRAKLTISAKGHAEPSQSEPSRAPPSDGAKPDSTGA